MAWWGPQGWDVTHAPWARGQGWSAASGASSLRTRLRVILSWGSGEPWQVFEQGCGGFSPRLLDPGLMGRHNHSGGWENEMILHKILRA